jgi:hypothetical protein
MDSESRDWIPKENGGNPGIDTATTTSNFQD